MAGNTFVTVPNFTILAIPTLHGLIIDQYRIDFGTSFFGSSDLLIINNVFFPGYTSIDIEEKV